MLISEKKCTICNEEMEMNMVWQHSKCLLHVGYARGDSNLVCTHVMDCQTKRCESSGEEIKKIEDAQHLLTSHPAVVLIFSCPRCLSGVKEDEFAQHIVGCMVPRENCRLCKGVISPNYNCMACPVCTTVSNVGATMSIIADDCAIKNGIRFWPDETKVRLADDRIVDVCGKTEALEHKENNILLGIDNFNLTGAGIFPKQRLIKYDKHKRNDGIISKLAPRWLGPYKIFDHDERGNYFRQDETGSGLTQKFPLEKLKIVEKEVFDTNVGEVECILDERTKNNKIEYLIKWKENKKQEWISEDRFETVDIINKYWKGKQLSKNNEDVAKRHPCFGLEENLFCSSSEIFGIGYKCKVDRIDMNCNENILGSKYCTTSDWQPIALNQEACWYMVEKKRCRIETDDYVFGKTMSAAKKFAHSMNTQIQSSIGLMRIICMDINA
ncbi:hypothetical protein BpHYR1_034492 [Brachionus plicatilis]|uniref:Chromo domain-containing protein n=1 Tax=Brachionus plicatilis TaxID=10195 RepID=A0A3M7RPH4_BRAPC|nr:hypothetical protein BpHYR1_034492 [Brachionus plicatilis]